ncbi:LysM peptidoglycan-binding domain-containing protein [Frigoribacterium sp. ACAM 257]|uniref:LysM peptidoglycan-binding domain-containing protein n=1 Tax=Frigoribacterium sp. ACAM 257 TaxID=2508998 RepID=UPI0011BA1350|nr:LysM peptidoglycan-binding domain-containing protein [Frigoribacterium sp. ACAM 257]TWX34157.1 LysM peptidoglycan-binding domain-containing protein [Frigoribacterium sp. ACAM 257]
MSSISSSTLGTTPGTGVPRTRLRITRRGRRVVGAAVALGAAGIVATGLLLGPGAVASDRAADVSFAQVTVEGGESLWQVASEIAPTKDPRDVVSDLVRLNNLPSAEVAAGQTLAVPEKYSR